MSIQFNRIERMASPAPLRVGLVNQLIDAANRIRSVAGDGRFIAADIMGESLNIRWVGPPIVYPALPWDARISATATQEGANFRWTYPVVEIFKDTAGYGGWSDVTGGRTGTAYAMAEDGNTSSGLQMSGVDDDNLVGTYAHQPLPVGRKVRIKTHTLTDGTKEFWIIGADNGIDGACS